ncbi:hypothetical protein MMPV_008807 [Pyropia vietnamensis]
MVSRSAAHTFTPQQLEGPFFLDTRTFRRDLTNGRPGVPLYLCLRVVGGCGSGDDGCQPRRDALVDVWHTDSRGIYRYVVCTGSSLATVKGRESGVALRLGSEFLRFSTRYRTAEHSPSDATGGGGSSSPLLGFSDRGVNATASDWMRGAAVSSSDGGVLFRSIIPGWYPGRLAHVHVKVRLAGLAAPIVPGYSSGNSGGWRGFTTQLYLPDPLVRSVYANPPYRSLWSYDSDVGHDIVLAGDAAEYAALTMDVWPATAAWVKDNGLNRGEPDRWGLGYVAKYTLRLMG